MARAPRIDVAGVAQHIVQRGVNRSVCFCDELDREFYLALLREVAPAASCHIHAYVLMTNHVHLLVTADVVGGLGAMMQRLGTCYVRRFNARYRRTGTLWEGRFRSSLVESERYVLTCYRYIEMNPVRAGMVGHPQDYPWSSVHANAGGRQDPLVQPHPIYLQLDHDPDKRTVAYRAILYETLPQDELTTIRAHTNQGKVLGRPSFQKQIEEMVGRSVRLTKVGRPRNPPDTQEKPKI